MCGIVGHIGKAPLRKFLFTGLSSLQYRGYDSAGIAFMDEQKNIVVYKSVGTVENLETITPQFESHIGIGHTRWATNGLPNKNNAHPQVSQHGRVAIVHNGVIENHSSLRIHLQNHGVKFQSSTDTEIIANFLEHQLLLGAKPLDAIKRLFFLFEGSFAIAVLFQGEERLYFAKRLSPLVLGRGKEGNYCASDPAALVGYANQFFDLEDGDYGYLTEEQVILYREDQMLDPRFAIKDLEHYEINLNGYSHFMLKEIEEEPSVIEKIMNKENLFSPELLSLMRNASSLRFLACGSSFHAALLAARYARSLGLDAYCYRASEFNVDPFYPQEKNAVFVLLSQSGETVDTLDSFYLLKSKGYPLISITNAKESNLARKTECHLYLDCGVEVAVAATKTYMAEVALLYRLLSEAFDKEYKTFFEEAIFSLKEVIARKNEISYLASPLARANRFYFLGRADSYDASLECALKVKEVSGVSCEAFPSGEFKHGPIALIEKGTPILVFLGEKGGNFIRLNVEEAENRGADTTIISSCSQDDIVLPHAKGELSALSFVMFGQYLSYYLALELGKPCDRPQNLAKSVTVR